MTFLERLILKAILFVCSCMILHVGTKEREKENPNTLLFIDYRISWIMIALIMYLV